VNLYAYASNDPVLFFDASGLITESVGLGAMAGFGFGGKISVDRVSDGKQCRWLGTVGIGPFLGYGAGVGYDGAVTTAPSLEDLKGLSIEQGFTTPVLDGSYTQGIPTKPNSIAPAKPGSYTYEGWTLGKSLFGRGAAYYKFFTYTVDLGPCDPPTPKPEPFDPYPIFKYFPKAQGQVPVNVAPRDPNDIIGPTGFGEEKWTSASSTLPYTIRFENISTATAPAQTVTVTHPLDTDLDLRTFRLSSFGWGGLIFDVPANTAFYNQRLDLTATRGYFVDVTAGIDLVKGEAFWIVTTIDPNTGDVPVDPLTGFLPPNNTDGIGDGFLNYTIKAKRDVTTGTVIDAKATIVFDK
jgi:hypothetical protein